MPKKNKNNIIYYQDPINDEFANNITKKYIISDDFKYIHKNIIFRFFSFILYHFIAIPIFWIILKCKFHVRVHDKKNIKEIKKQSFFVYSNHTQNIIDAFISHAMVFTFKKGHIVAHNDVYSLKGLNTIVNMLGAMPTPNNMIQSKNFYDAINFYTNNKKDVIVIYPEAHIWPYYNDIRPFLDNGFIFPATLNKPIVPITIVYRKRKYFKSLHPFIDLYVGKPIYPKKELNIKENQKYLRDEAYKIMKEYVKTYNSYAYIEYRKKD